LTGNDCDMFYRPKLVPIGRLDIRLISCLQCIEDSEYEADFWEWVNEGMQGQGDEEEDEPVDAFVWTGARSPHPGESDGQQKCRLIQEALFNALYP